MVVLQFSRIGWVSPFSKADQLLLQENNNPNENIEIFLPGMWREGDDQQDKFIETPEEHVK